MYVSIVNVQASGGLTSVDIERMLKEAKEQKEHDERIKAEAEARNEAESLIMRAENDYLQSEAPIPDHLKQKIKEAVAQTKKAVEAKNDVKQAVKVCLQLYRLCIWMMNETNTYGTSLGPERHVDVRWCRDILQG